MNHPSSNALREETCTFLNSPNHDFESLSLKIFAHQFNLSHSYQDYCASINITPETITHWTHIPALTTDLFKIPKLYLSTLPKEKTTYTFETSGTTTEIKGKHHFPETSTYEKSIIEGWKQARLPENLPITFLSPPHHSSETSSLAHMFRTLNLHLNQQTSPPSFQDLTEKQQPFILFGTALSFLSHIEGSPPLPLPKDSLIIETGGYKGLRHTISKTELYQKISHHFDIAIDNIYNEYSMTELSSQCYTQGLNQPHRSPPWLKIQVINPETNQAVSPGETGYLQLHDLANYHSVQVIRTQDLATFHDHHTFTLHGRDPNALPRGCSRSIS